MARMFLLALAIAAIGVLILAPVLYTIDQEVPAPLPFDTDAVSPEGELAERFWSVLRTELKNTVPPDERVAGLREDMRPDGSRLYGQLLNRSCEIREKFLADVRYDALTEENYKTEAQKVLLEIKKFMLAVSLLQENQLLCDPARAIELTEDEQAMLTKWSTQGRELLNREYLSPLRAHPAFRTMRATYFLEGNVRSMVMMVLIVDKNDALASHIVGSISFDALRVMNTEEQDDAVRKFLQKALEIVERHDIEK